MIRRVLSAAGSAVLWALAGWWLWLLPLVLAVLLAMTAAEGAS